MTVTIAMVRILPFAAVLTLLSVTSLASTCVNGSCHAKTVQFKFLHGPLAAEQQVGGGCISCHKSSGAACTPAAKGVFTYAEAKDKLCMLCHDKSESPDHIGRTTNCLKCHNPHGSDKNMKMTRF